MRTLRSISEDEFVAAVLGCEYDSLRFGAQLRRLLDESALPADLVLSPDLADETQNDRRRSLLGALRGYRRGRELLGQMPDDVRWERAVMTSAELAEVMYIDYSYWNELTSGSRMPADGAERVRTGIEVYGVGYDFFWRAAEAVRAGAPFREMIFVSHDGVRWVVIEGHVRLTSFFLAGALPDEIEVIAGRSPRMVDWPLY